MSSSFNMSTMECFQSSRSLRLLASPSSTAATSTFWAPLWTGAVPVAPAPGVLVVDACTGGALAPTMVAPEAEASLAPACPNIFDMMFPKRERPFPQRANNLQNGPGCGLLQNPQRRRIDKHQASGRAAFSYRAVLEVRSILPLLYLALAQGSGAALPLFRHRKTQAKEVRMCSSPAEVWLPVSSACSPERLL